MSSHLKIIKLNNRIWESRNLLAAALVRIKEVARGIRSYNQTINKSLNTNQLEIYRNVSRVKTKKGVARKNYGKHMTKNCDTVHNFTQ